MIINCYCSPLRFSFPFTFDSFSVKCFQLSTQTKTHTIAFTFKANRFVRVYFLILALNSVFRLFHFSMRLYLCAVVSVCVWTFYILGSDICLLHHLMAKCTINANAQGQNFIRFCVFPISILTVKLIASD